MWSTELEVVNIGLGGMIPGLSRPHLAVDGSGCHFKMFYLFSILLIVAQAHTNLSPQNIWLVLHFLFDVCMYVCMYEFVC